MPPAPGCLTTTTTTTVVHAGPSGGRGGGERGAGTRTGRRCLAVRHGRSTGARGRRGAGAQERRSEVRMVDRPHTRALGSRLEEQRQSQHPGSPSIRASGTCSVRWTRRGTGPTARTTKISTHHRPAPATASRTVATLITTPLNTRSAANSPIPYHTIEALCAAQSTSLPVACCLLPG